MTEIAAAATKEVSRGFTIRPHHRAAGSEPGQGDQGARQGNGEHDLAQHQRLGRVEPEPEQNQRRNADHQPAQPSDTDRCKNPCITICPV